MPRKSLDTPASRELSSGKAVQLPPRAPGHAGAGNASIKRAFVTLLHINGVKLTNDLGATTPEARVRAIAKLME